MASDCTAGATAAAPTVWETKRRVEAEYPDFPHIDISAPDFDLSSYGRLVQSMLRSANIPIVPFSITWTDLACIVPLEPPAHAIATVFSGLRAAFSALKHGFAHPRGHAASDAADAQPSSGRVLDAASGYLRPGEMCLVLGRSGSGTSLLLQRLAGRPLPRLIQSTGDVLYQGEERLAGVAKPSHILNYIPQDDTHIAQLTVRQTLRFAAECSWPYWVPHVDVLRKLDVELGARVLGLTRVLDTVVGSNELRGVSGGERKRVTIGEMATGLVAGTLIMDNWSKGLDSGTTLSITRSMREFADMLLGSVIVSMQAPGSEVFALFDTLCLLDEGKLLYFGPAADAESYFNSLGFSRPSHRSLPDFISTLTDDNLRSDYVDPRATEQPPATVDEFAQAFRNSTAFARMDETIREINAEPRMEMPPGSELVGKLAQKNTLQNPRHQIAAMVRRQGNYLTSIRRTVLTEMLQNVIFGLLLGSMFWQLPETQAGAGSRDGVVFLSLLFITLGSLAKVPERYDEKVVFAKQRAASFFDAWTYLLTQIIFDLLIELAKTMCLFIPLYLMAGLNLGSSAQRLLYAVLVAALMSLVMISITRFYVAIVDEPSAAGGLVGFTVIVMVLFCGYLKNGSELDPWLVWIYWANPIHYSLEALLINEFEGLVFECAAGEFLPQDPNVPAEFRACPVSTGERYLSDFRGINNPEIYRLYYFLVILAFQVFSFCLSAVATALSRPKGFAKKSTHPAEHLNMDEGVHVNVNEDPEAQQSTNFTFSGMSYSVDNGSKILLDTVSGYTTSGKVVLLMGESGAGKTTLLDVCAMRKTLGAGATVAGEIRLNGKLLGIEELAHVTGYCEQNDLHVGEATVYEAVLFSAKLRLPKSVSLEEKQRRTQDVITMLGLEVHMSSLVKSLGSGEMKLVTMAVEVVAAPKVLFLDEPTSGLSSSSAFIVARALRRIANSGTAVICTVHQPSTEVFTMFDSLLLLKRGGHMVYFGDIGEHGATLLDYFRQNGAKEMKSGENPAAWMLDVISNDSVDWVETWKSSAQCAKADAELSDLIARGDPGGSGDFKFDGVPLPMQLVDVIRRQFWRYWRLPEYNLTRVILNLMTAIMLGLLFLRDIDDSQTGASLAFGALFMTIVPASIAGQNVIPTTVEGRVVFYRELASGTYKAVAYHVAVGLVELPFTVFSTAVFAVVYYFMAGLDPSRFFYYFLATQLLYVMLIMFGIMLASIIPEVALADNIENSIVSILQVLSGFFILKPNMPVWWRWTVWVNPFNYFLSGVVQNQMSGKTLSCSEDELAAFRLPTGVSRCEDISGGIYPSLPPTKSQETLCALCPTPTGQALIDRFGADDVNKWVALVALLVAILVFRFVAAIGFTKMRFITR